MTGIKYTDLKIVRDETGAVVTVKSATVDSKDNTKVTIETYEALSDGKTYTVTYTAADEAKTESSANFTATAGVVADIALNTYSVPAGAATEIKYQLLDANGVLIEEKGIGKSASSNMEISIENFNGYQSNNDLLLYKTGDKATLKVVYHTYKYNNTNGTEDGKVEKTFEIVAVDPSSVIETYEYSVADVTAVVDFKRDTLKTQLAIEDDKAPSDPYAFFSFRKADGTDITKSLDYTVSSGNENVLLANGTVAGGAQLTPVGVGATYLEIKNASGAVVKILPITVVAKRELSTMTVDQPNVTLSTSSTSVGTQTITIAVMDQYSDAYSKYTPDALPALKSSNNDAGISFTVSKSGNKTSVKVTTTNAEPGTYSYTLDLADDEKATNVKKVSFSVTVARQLTGTSLALVMMNDTQTGIVSKVDTTVGTGDYNDITLMPTIVVKNNGSIIRKANIGGAATDDVVSYGALTLKKNGVTVDVTKGYYTNTSTSETATNAKVYVADADGTSAQDFVPGTKTIVKNLEPGTYTVSLTAYFGNKKYQNMSTSFVVEDSQKVFEASVKKEAVEAGISTLEGVFENENYVKFSYAGHEVNYVDYNYEYVSAETTYTNVNKALRVKKVTVDMVLPGTANKVVRMTADVNRTFTFADAVTSSGNVTNNIATFNSAYVSGSALKPGVTTGQCIDAVNYALYIKEQFDALTTAEKTTALTTKVNTVTSVGEEAAVEILKNFDTIGATDQANVLWDTLVILGANPKSARLSDYVYLVSGNSAAFASLTVSTAKAKMAQMVTDIETADTASLSTADVTYVAGKIATVNADGTGVEILPVASGSVIAVTSATAITATGAATFTSVAVAVNASNELSITPNDDNSGNKCTVTCSAITVRKTVTVDGRTKNYDKTYNFQNPVVKGYTSNGSWSIDA